MRRCYKSGVKEMEEKDLLKIKRIVYEALFVKALTGKDSGAVKVKKETDLGDAVKIEMTVDLTALGLRFEEATGLTALNNELNGRA